MLDPFLYSYKMFEPNLDDYLDDEIEELKRALEVICKDWARSVPLTDSSMVCISYFPLAPCCHLPFLTRTLCAAFRIAQ